MSPLCQTVFPTSCPSHYPPRDNLRLISDFSVASPLHISCVSAKSLQSCLTLCGPMDCSLPGSPVRGILQARTLELVAIPYSKGYSQPRDRTCISYGSCTEGGFFTAEPLGKPSPHLIGHQILWIPSPASSPTSPTRSLPSFLFSYQIKQIKKNKTEDYPVHKSMRSSFGDKKAY